MKFALVVGHEQSSQGAKGVPPLHCSEYEYNKGLAGMIGCDLLDFQIQSEIFFRDKIGIHGVYQQVNRYLPQGVVELHFNASGLTRVRGTETLYVPRINGSKALALNVQECMVHALSRSTSLDRGIVIPDLCDRGYVNLTQAHCPSILVEPFFGDNEEDAKLAVDLKSELAQSIAEGIHRFLKGIE